MCESGITCPTNSIHGQVGHGTPVFYLKKEKTSVNACKQTIYRGFRVPEAGLEPARLYRPRDFKSLVSTNSTTQALTQKIPNCFGTLWSGKRDSNSRPRPWQGRALPTELFPLCLQIGNLITFAQGFRLVNCVAKVQLFSILQAFFEKNTRFFCFFLIIR